MCHQRPPVGAGTARGVRVQVVSGVIARLCEIRYRRELVLFAGGHETASRGGRPAGTGWWGATPGRSGAVGRRSRLVTSPPKRLHTLQTLHLDRSLLHVMQMLKDRTKVKQGRAGLILTPPQGDSRTVLGGNRINIDSGGHPPVEGVRPPACPLTRLSHRAHRPLLLLTRAM
jgi:hypothetical protein